MSASTTHARDRSCRGSCRSRATEPSMACAAAVAGRARPSGGNSRARPRERGGGGGGPLAVGALLVAAAGGGGGWSYRAIAARGAERDRLAARVGALEDPVSSFIGGAGTRLIQIPVSTGGRVGS